MAGRTLMAAALLAAVWSSGPAEAQQAGDLGDLRYRLSVIDGQLADIRARIGDAPGGRAPSGGAMVRLDRLEAELRSLTGRLERLEYAQRRIVEDATRRFADVEFRLTELEGGDISALGAPVPVGGAASAATGGQEGRAPAPRAEISVSEQNDLARAVEDVRQGRFDLAETRLGDFVETYPSSPLRPAAQYWLGESLFARGIHDQAARAYLTGFRADEGGDYAPRNLLQLGISLGRLGQRPEACATLKEVPRRFPRDNEAARIAAEERGRLACP